MGLTPGQAQVIRERIRGCMGQHARIWLFGSRADDSRRGDADLYVEPEKQSGRDLPIPDRQEAQGGADAARTLSALLDTGPH